MPLSITREAWLQETRGAWNQPRSAALKRLDDAIGSGNPFAAKESLDAWIAKQIREGRDWRQSVRNQTGAVERLHREVGLRADVEAVVERFASTAADCRAGTRVMQAHTLTEPATGFTRDLRNAGYERQVERDTLAMDRFYEATRELGRKVAEGNVPSELKPAFENPPTELSLTHDRQPFSTWACTASNSCVSMGSSDAVAWVKKLSESGGLDWGRYDVRFRDAQNLGRQEEDEFQEAVRQYRMRTEVMKKPAEKTMMNEADPVRGVNDYLIAIIKMNASLDENILRIKWDEERTRIFEEIGVVDENDPVIKWPEARAAARAGRR